MTLSCSRSCSGMKTDTLLCPLKALLPQNKIINRPASREKIAKVVLQLTVNQWALPKKGSIPFLLIICIKNYRLMITIGHSSGKFLNFHSYSLVYLFFFIYPKYRTT